ncbi:MAG: hypothetical protein WC617_10745 [Rhodanobacter sp.]
MVKPFLTSEHPNEFLIADTAFTYTDDDGQYGQDLSASYPQTVQDNQIMTSFVKRLATVAPFFLLAALSACGGSESGANATAGNNPTAMTEVANISVSDSRVGTLVGIKNPTRGLTSDQRSGVLMYGPYIKIQPGKYQVVIRGQYVAPTSTAPVTLDVVHDKGATTLVTTSIVKPEDQAKGVLATLDFEAPNGAEDLEVRAIVPAKADATIGGYSIYKFQ